MVEEPWGRHQEEESLLQKIVGRIGDIFRVWRRVGSSQFDTLIVQTTTELRNFSRDVPVMWICRRRVRCIVVQFHGSTPETVLGAGNTMFKVAARWLFRLADAVIVSSTEEQREWRKFQPDASILTTTNPYVSPEGTDSSVVANLWNLPRGVPVVLFVGRMIPQKGIFDLLEAVAQLDGNVPFHLLMVGYGPAVDDFQARAKDLKVDGRVTVAGFVNEAQLRSAYRSADVFVLPSWSEGFPTVLMEAMDAGLPIVTTRIRGAVDCLDEGVHACFVPSRDPKQLAEALGRVLSNPGLRAGMGTTNRIKVKDFSPEAVGRHYFGLLRQIAVSKTQGGTARIEVSHSA